MSRLALITSVAILASSAPTVSRAQHIDGSSRSAFEHSVASFQKQLPPRSREQFETALAVIWLTNTIAHARDLDHDGDVDLDDIRALDGLALDILQKIRRGDLVSTIEKRGGTNGYTAQDYFEQLDGLGYEDVLSLAARPGTRSPVDVDAQGTSPVAAIWFGTLKPPRQGASRDLSSQRDQERPTLLEITRAADGTYRGRLTSINEGNAVALLTAVNVDGDKVRYRLPVALPGFYEGNLSADGATITGTWTQAGVAPLVFHKLVR